MRTAGARIAVRRPGGAEVAAGVAVARDPWRRFRGLMGRRELPDGDGLLLDPCNGIHMLFMHLPLDVVFLSRERRVVRLVAGIRPWRGVVWFVPGARSALELPVGTIARSGLTVGETLELAPVPPAQPAPLATALPR